MGIKRHRVLKESLKNKALVLHVEILLSLEGLTRESDELPSISARVYLRLRLLTVHHQEL